MEEKIKGGRNEDGKTCRMKGKKGRMKGKRKGRRKESRRWMKGGKEEGEKGEREEGKEGKDGGMEGGGRYYSVK